MQLNQIFSCQNYDKYFSNYTDSYNFSNYEKIAFNINSHRYS